MPGDAAGVLAREAGTGGVGLGLSRRVAAAVRERVVGQDAAVEALLIALLTGGHVLLEGLPGLAKTLMVRTLANAIHTGFSRIQFTPDLLPSDIAGTPILDPRTGEFRVHKGPVFSNIVLADEINRAPPKVQAALLEAMEERQVSIAGETFPLSDPFMVLATQNPVELHGTYPLAEAQLDRFAMKLDIRYPSRDEEKEIVRWAGDRAGTPLEAVATVEEVYRARERGGGGAPGGDRARLHRRTRLRHARAGRVRTWRAGEPDRFRHFSAGVDLSGAHIARAGLAAGARLRAPRRRQGDGAEGIAAPVAHDV